MWVHHREIIPNEDDVIQPEAFLIAFLDIVEQPGLLELVSFHQRNERQRLVKFKTVIILKEYDYLDTGLNPLISGEGTSIKFYEENYILLQLIA